MMLLLLSGMHGSVPMVRDAFLHRRYPFPIDMESGVAFYPDIGSGPIMGVIMSSMVWMRILCVPYTMAPRFFSVMRLDAEQPHGLVL
jgi:hypothetical protein